MYARRRRRDRLRRVHRERHAEDQRGPGRDGRRAAARGAVVDVRDAGRLPAVAPGVSPLPAPRRLLRVRRRAAPRSQRPLHRRSRPLVSEGGAQRRRTWRRGSPSSSSSSSLARRDRAARSRQVHIHHDCVRLSGSGCAAGRHGPGPRATRFDVCRDDVRGGGRRARRAAERAVLRGAGRSPAAHREHPAGDSRGERRRLPAGRVARPARRRLRRATASASTPRTWRPVRYPSRMPCGRCGAAGSTCRRRCRSARARWRRSSGSTRRAVDAACRAASQQLGGRVVSPANLNAPGQVVIAGHADAVARAGELARAGGAKRVIPLAVSAPFHCALMKPAEERLAADLRGLAVQRSAIPVVANVDAEPKRTRGASRSRRSSARCRAPVRWQDVVPRLVARGRDAGSWSSVPARCSPG